MTLLHVQKNNLGDYGTNVNKLIQLFQAFIKEL